MQDILKMSDTTKTKCCLEGAPGDFPNVVVIDGSFSSQLSQHVSAKVDGDPLWCARFLSDDPKAVINTHLDFLRAGAQVITTNTYQASIDGFVKYLGISEEEAVQLIVDGVSYAKAAIHQYQTEKKSEDTPPLKDEEGNEDRKIMNASSDKLLIAGSVGPYGAFLHDGSEYSGKYVETMTAKELARWHRPRIDALVRSGVDLVAFETIPSIVEAKVLVEILIREFPGQKAWLSFSSRDGERTAHGDNFKSAVQECWALGKEQLVAIGVNCIRPSWATSLLSQVANDAAQSLPLIVYPNSGESWDPEKGWYGKQLCEPLQTYIQKWLDLGVCYIGGCCRFYANDVASIREEVDACMNKRKTMMKN